jgi:hypothetical protein
MSITKISWFALILLTYSVFISNADKKVDDEFNALYDTQGSRYVGMFFGVYTKPCAEKNIQVDTAKISADLKECLRPIYTANNAELKAKIIALKDSDPKPESAEKFRKDLGGVCGSVPNIFECLKDASDDLIEKCSPNPDVEHKSVALANDLTQSLCKDDGKHLADFVVNNGDECGPALKDSITKCIEAKVNEKPSLNKFKTLDMKNATVADLQELTDLVLDCASKAVPQCPNKEAAMALQALIEDIKSDWSETFNHGSRIAWSSATAVLTVFISVSSCILRL